jgi:hypothetical protein
LRERGRNKQKTGESYTKDFCDADATHFETPELEWAQERVAIEQLWFHTISELICY